jgi:hypothetical protein
VTIKARFQGPIRATLRSPSDVGIVLSGIDNESRFAPHNTAFVDLGVSSRHAGSKGGAEPKGIGSVFQTLKDLHMIRAHSQTNILPRGLNIQAAAYWGVSPGTFKNCSAWPCPATAEAARPRPQCL